MIDRYTIGATNSALTVKYNVDVPSHYKPRFNAAPSQLLPVITSESPGGLSFFYWGLPPTQTNKKEVSERIINVKSETIQDKALFRKKVRTHRCIIPADGFYVWKKIGKKTVTPYYLSFADRAVFSIAGIWEEYEDIHGERFHTYMLITQISPTELQSLSDRIPLILSLENQALWLSSKTQEEEIIGILSPVASAPLEAYSVSPVINDLNVDNKTLIMPAPASDQFGNLTLFD